MTCRARSVNRSNIHATSTIRIRAPANNSRKIPRPTLIYLRAFEAALLGPRMFHHQCAGWSLRIKLKAVSPASPGASTSSKLQTHLNRRQKVDRFTKRHVA